MLSHGLERMVRSLTSVGETNGGTPPELGFTTTVHRVQLALLAFVVVGNAHPNRNGEVFADGINQVSGTAAIRVAVIALGTERISVAGVQQTEVGTEVQRQAVNTSILSEVETVTYGEFENGLLVVEVIVEVNSRAQKYVCGNTSIDLTALANPEVGRHVRIPVVGEAYVHREHIGNRVGVADVEVHFVDAIIREGEQATVGSHRHSSPHTGVEVTTENRIANFQSRLERGAGQFDGTEHVLAFEIEGASH